MARDPESMEDAAGVRIRSRLLSPPPLWICVEMRCLAAGALLWIFFLFFSGWWPLGAHPKVNIVIAVDRTFFFEKVHSKNSWGIPKTVTMIFPTDLDTEFSWWRRVRVLPLSGFGLGLRIKMRNPSYDTIQKVLLCLHWRGAIIRWVLLFELVLICSGVSMRGTQRAQNVESFVDDGFDGSDRQVHGGCDMSNGHTSVSHDEVFHSFHFHLHSLQFLVEHFAHHLRRFLDQPWRELPIFHCRIGQGRFPQCYLRFFIDSLWCLVFHHYKTDGGTPLNFNHPLLLWIQNWLVYNPFSTFI